MRITSRMMMEQSVQRMDEARELLSLYQARAATGKQFQNISDNPNAATTSLGLRSSLSQNQAYLDTMHVSADWLDASEAALAQVVDLGTKALGLAKQGLSDTLGAAERRALAQDLDSLLQAGVEAGNASHRGSFLFAGFQVNTTPYTYTAAAVVANVASTAGPIQHSLGQGQTLTVNTDGNAVLLPLYQALTAARDALNANDTTALNTALGNLKTASAGVADARSVNGGRRRQLQGAMDRIEQTQVTLKELLSHNQDANLAEAISQLKLQETVYQAVLEVGSRTLPASLFDFLR
jgi:flagellar hook-associated protein 3 FlgL